MLRKLVLILLVLITPAMVFARAAVEEPTGPQPLSMFVEGRGTIDPGNDVILDAFAERTGLDLQIEMPPGSGIIQRLQILLAGGDLPDIVQFPNGTTATHREAAEDGLVIAIDDYLASAPNIMAAVETNTWTVMKLLDDGLIYGIPKGTMNRQDGFAVRKDWLEKFGMSIPESGIVTMDDFVTMLRHFTFDDPDGNGRDDTFGMSFRAQAIPQLNGTFGIFGWQRATAGPYDYMTAQWDQHTDNFKNSLAFNAMIWTEGLVNPDWQGNAWDQFLAGNNGIQATLAGNLPPREAVLRENVPGAELDYIARVVLNAGDEPAGTGFSGGAMWGQLAISSGAEERGRVQRAIDFLDWNVDPDGGWDIVTNGLEGIHYNVVGGKKVFTEAYGEFAGLRKGYGFLRPYADNRFTIGPADMDDETAAKLLRWTEASQLSLYQTRDHGYVPEAGREQVYIDFQSTMEETWARISLGELPVSAWDDALVDWYANGGKEYVEDMNDYISRYNP